MVLITIVNGVYKPTYNWRAPPCSKTNFGGLERNSIIGMELQCPKYHKSVMEKTAPFMESENHPIEIRTKITGIIGP